MTTKLYKESMDRIISMSDGSGEAATAIHALWEASSQSEELEHLWEEADNACNPCIMIHTEVIVRTKRGEKIPATELKALANEAWGFYFQMMQDRKAFEEAIRVEQFNHPATKGAVTDLLEASTKIAAGDKGSARVAYEAVLQIRNSVLPQHAMADDERWPNPAHLVSDLTIAPWGDVDLTGGTFEGFNLPEISELCGSLHTHIDRVAGSKEGEYDHRSGLNAAYTALWQAREQLLPLFNPAFGDFDSQHWMLPDLGVDIGPPGGRV